MAKIGIVEIKRTDKIKTMDNIYKKILLVSIGIILIITCFYKFGLTDFFNFKKTQLIKVEAQNASDIEEQASWSESNPVLIDDHQPHTPGSYQKNYNDKKSGGYSIELNGRDKRDVYTISTNLPPNLPIGQKYRLSFWLKIKDRKCYDIKEMKNNGYTYPSYLNIAVTNNFWCGKYDVSIKQPDQGPPRDILIQRQIQDAEYVFTKDRDWFYNETTFQSTVDNSQLFFMLTTYAFLGNILIDNIQIEEIDSFVKDEDLKIPSTYSDMKIVSQNNSETATTGAKFQYDGQNISGYHSSDINLKLANIQFPAQALTNLHITETGQGYTIYENDNVLLSVGADSTIIIKLKNNLDLNVTGIKPNYSFFKQGLIYIRDTEPNSSNQGNGFQFFPLAGSADYRRYVTDGLPASYDPIVTQQGDFSTPNWNVTYNSKAGDAFVFSVFPPKNFDINKYCKNRSSTLHAPIDRYSVDDVQYYVDSFKDYYNVAIIWPDYYATVNNFQFEGFNPNIFPDIYGTRASKFYDEQGLFTIRDLSKFKDYVNTLHSKGLKVLLYMSPRYFYTQNQDILIQNLKNNLEATGADGVYLDGIYDVDPITNLKFNRHLRHVLKDIFVVQHVSWNHWFLADWENNAKFRLPFLDAYADMLWLGEGVPYSDPDVWQNAYGGKDLSNSISVLLGQNRPPLTIYDQIIEQVKNFGQIHPGFYDQPFKRFWKEATNLFDFQNYLTELDKVCLPVTCGNGVKDLGENVFTCLQDTTRQSQPSINLDENKNLVIDTETPVANWLINNNPLFKLHFDFNQSPAKDISGLNLNPGTYNGNVYKAPESREADNKKTYYFDGTSSLYGYHGYSESDKRDVNIDLNKGFSILANIKKENDTKQVIYSQGKDNNYFMYFGTQNGKPFVSIKDLSQDPNLKQCISTQTIDNNWHQVGLTYDKGSGMVNFYIDGNKADDCHIGTFTNFNDDKYYIGKFGSLYYFKGYIDDLAVTDKTFTEAQMQSFLQTNYKKLVNIPLSDMSMTKVLLKNDNNYYYADVNPLYKKADKKFAAANGVLTYSIIYTNIAGKDINNLILSDQIPAKTEYVGDSATYGGTFRDGEITWNILSLPSDQTFTAQFKVNILP